MTKTLEEMCKKEQLSRDELQERLLRGDWGRWSRKDPSRWKDRQAELVYVATILMLIITSFFCMVDPVFRHNYAIPFVVVGGVLLLVYVVYEWRLWSETEEEDSTF